MKKLVCLLIMLMGNQALFAGDFSALTRAEDVKLRIGSYNVYYSSCLPADDGGPSGNGNNRVENFTRIVNAMDADILSLQEVFHAPKYFLLKTPEGILAHMEEITGESWYMAHDHEIYPDQEPDPPDGSTGKGGRFIFSRYPILWQDHFNNRITAALIDLPTSVSDKDALVVNVHYSAQVQADKTGEFVAKVAAGEIAGIPSDVMIMVCGDFNGTEGKARYNAVFDSIPDFTNLRPTHLGWNEPNYTTIGSTYFDNNWNPIDIYTKVDSDTGEIIAKAIDYMFWRSDRLETKHAHILNPMIMDQTTLNTYGLQQVDTALDPEGGLKTNLRADHWPYFADFIGPDGGEPPEPGPNLINNPSFESGDSSGWTVPSEAAVTADSASHGTYSLKLSHTNHITNTRQIVDLKPNTDYTFTIDINSLIKLGREVPSGRVY